MKPKSSPQKQEQTIKHVANSPEKAIYKKDQIKDAIHKLVDVLDSAGILGAEAKKQIKSLLDE